MVTTDRTDPRGVGRVRGHVVVDGSGSLLTAFQIEVAQLLFSLPASGGFLLAGGGALLAQGLTARPTQDLDFFTQADAGDVGLARDQFLAAASGRGWAVDRVQDGGTFCRLLVHGSADLLVDLALDSAPGRPASASIAGPTFAPGELAGRKIIALFDRAAARDFVDVHALSAAFPRQNCSTWPARSTAASTCACSLTCSGALPATATSISLSAMSTSPRCGCSSSNGSPNLALAISEAASTDAGRVSIAVGPERFRHDGRP
jgi:hypothetical protein